jgi:hypothetical protein
MLVEAGYVSVDTSYRGRKPCTMIRLSAKSRRAVERYRLVMRETLTSCNR